ncbi:MAG: FtsX-like permease family protein, partial [Bacteroidetes bacterium]|nr:FtsX-like permease family protein [Bacteroidota bacterium]
AVGATRSNIMFQFVSEAIIICQIGGIAGIFLGAVAGNLVSLLMEVPAYFPYLWAFIGVVICSLVGVVFGSYPAYKAANLDPIAALRYE